MSGLPSPTEEDYSEMWRLDVSGKTVLDLGADWGSTADYFLRCGALRVTCIEGSAEMYKQLLANLPLLNYQVEPVYLQIVDTQTMTQALNYPAEIVKIDIEGAEEHLLGVSAKTIKSHAAYMIEFHEWQPKSLLIKDYLALCGFTVCEVAQNEKWTIAYFYRM